MLDRQNSLIHPPAGQTEGFHSEIYASSQQLLVKQQLVWKDPVWESEKSPPVKFSKWPLSLTHSFSFIIV